MPAKPSDPLTFMFQDDGSIPNNPLLPLLVYRNALALPSGDGAENAVERVFGQHHWGEIMGSVPARAATPRLRPFVSPFRCARLKRINNSL